MEKGSARWEVTGHVPVRSVTLSERGKKGELAIKALGEQRVGRGDKSARLSGQEVEKKARKARWGLEEHWNWEEFEMVEAGGGMGRGREQEADIVDEVERKREAVVGRERADREVVTGKEVKRSQDGKEDGEGGTLPSDECTEALGKARKVWQDEIKGQEKSLIQRRLEEIEAGKLKNWRGDQEQRRYPPGPVPAGRWGRKGRQAKQGEKMDGCGSFLEEDIAFNKDKVHEHRANRRDGKGGWGVCKERVAVAGQVVPSKEDVGRVAEHERGESRIVKRWGSDESLGQESILGICSWEQEQVVQAVWWEQEDNVWEDGEVSTSDEDGSDDEEDEEWIGGSEFPVQELRAGGGHQ